MHKHTDQTHGRPLRALVVVGDAARPGLFCRLSCRPLSSPDIQTPRPQDVLGKPGIGRIRVGEHLEMILVPDLLAGVDVNPNGSFFFSYLHILKTNRNTTVSVISSTTFSASDTIVSVPMLSVILHR
jgi:hypothetical protein